MKKFLKENLKQIIIMILLIVVVNIELPYYIEAPGGTINLTERINKDYKKEDGSLNMLYVTGYRGNIVTVLLGNEFAIGLIPLIIILALVFVFEHGCELQKEVDETL